MCGKFQISWPWSSFKLYMEWIYNTPLRGGKRAYYAFENTCNHGDMKCWVLEKFLLNTLVTPLLFYGVMASLNPLGKSLKMSKNIFLQSFFKLSNKRHTPSSLRWELPVKIVGIERVVEYMLKVQIPSHRLF